MKHLIETADSSSLATVPYDRIVLDTTTNEIVCKGGGYEYVDLGLPSGLKWAKCNVGAETETDYGDYFMWGSTTPNEECTWAKTPFNNGSSDYNETYFNSVKDTVCPNGVLAKEYDAASQIMGGDWRMPTASEYQTLYNETLWVWCPGGNVGIKKTDKSGNESIEYIAYPTGYFVFKTNSDKRRKGTFTKDENDNLIGYTATSGTVYYPGAHEVTEGDVTSIADGDIHIFFPASGYANGTGVYLRGSGGGYWSSSLHPSRSYSGLHLSFGSDSVYPQNDNNRYYGFTVRGVME